jgi:hypothetical protein
MKNKYTRKSFLEWVYTPSGYVFVRDKRTQKTYVLKENLMLVWIVMDTQMTFKKIQLLTGLETLKLETILGELIKHKLIFQGK